MSTDKWLKDLSSLFYAQPKPAWFPAWLWLSPQQRAEILQALLQPRSDNTSKRRT